MIHKSLGSMEYTTCFGFPESMNNSLRFGRYRQREENRRTCSLQQETIEIHGQANSFNSCTICRLAVMLALNLLVQRTEKIEIGVFSGAHPRV